MGTRSPRKGQLFIIDTYNDLVDELVNKHEVCSEVVLLKTATEVMDSAYDGAEKLQGHRGNDLAAS